MAQWDNTLYIRWKHVDSFFAVAEHVFAEDGYKRLRRTPRISQAQAQVMQYEAPLRAPFWALAWIPTPTDWSIVKTSPFELLCESGPRQVFPRLSEVCGLLECAGIQVNLQDGCALYTVECDERGVCCIAGARLQDLDREYEFDRNTTVRWEPMVDSSPPCGGMLFEKEKPFILNPTFNDALVGAYDEQRDHVETFGIRLTTLLPEVWDNMVQVEYLQQRKRPPIDGCVTVFFAAPKRGVR